MCMPQKANGSLDLTAPCNQWAILLQSCTSGLPPSDIYNSTVGTTLLYSTDSPPQSPANQRLCACESYYFDTMAGCNACWAAHGANDKFLYSDNILTSMSSSYCAATATPSGGIHDMLSQWNKGPVASSVISAGRAETSTSPFSDPLAGKTAVSLYTTPAVTGSAIFNIAGITRGATPTTTHVVHGQITNGAGSVGGEMGTTKVALAAVLALVACVTFL